MCLYIGGGTTGIMFCYQTDGPITGKGGGGEEAISGGTYNRDFVVFEKPKDIFLSMEM